MAIPLICEGNSYVQYTAKSENSKEMQNLNTNISTICTVFIRVSLDPSTKKSKMAQTTSTPKNTFAHILLFILSTQKYKNGYNTISDEVITKALTYIFKLYFSMSINGP
jgi:hypothetical protein